MYWLYIDEDRRNWGLFEVDVDGAIEEIDGYYKETTVCIEKIIYQTSDLFDEDDELENVDKYIVDNIQNVIKTIFTKKIFKNR